MMTQSLVSSPNKTAITGPEVSDLILSLKMAFQQKSIELVMTMTNHVVSVLRDVQIKMNIEHQVKEALVESEASMREVLA